MNVEQAIQRVLLGESLRMIAAAWREATLESVGLDPREALPETFARETQNFMRKVCRQLGEEHPGDQRAQIALRDWVHDVKDYEAWDALLTHYDFDGKEELIRRGRVLFAGPMTAHWDDAYR